MCLVNIYDVVRNLWCQIIVIVLNAPHQYKWLLMNQDRSPTTLHKRFYCPYPQVHALEKKLQNKITDILIHYQLSM